MFIESISLKGVGPIDDFQTNFREGINCVIGMNGCGKTHLLRVLAGVMGTEEATDLLLRDLPVRDCVITVLNRHGTRLTYTAYENFDLDDINEFKAHLDGERVNFPITEWVETFPFGQVGPFVVRDRFRFYMENTNRNCDDIFQYSGSRMRMMSGDGIKQALRVISGDGQDNVPTLMEFPEKHLDMTGKRVLSEMLDCRHRQLIFTTHSPEMLGPWVNKYGDEKIIDMSSDR